jgi:uncharacterized protein YbjT (DUF2867 family)
MILVAGGTGRLGSSLVPRLADRGLHVRVLTRDPSRARHLHGVATDIVVGDVRRPASLTAAMDEVTVVVSAVHGFTGPGRVTPRSVDQDGNNNLVNAAAEVGAAVVLMSAVGASTDSPMELFRAKYQAEQHLQHSGAPWTIVRATAFIELWADIMTKPIVLGRGDNPINFVSVHDVAAAVDRAVTDPHLRGRILEIGGPKNMTFNELAAMLQEVQEPPGGHQKTRHVPRPLLRTLSPIARRAAAAYTMDTTAMTFDPDTPRDGFEAQTVTDLRTAVINALASSRRPTRHHHSPSTTHRQSPVGEAEPSERDTPNRPTT